MYLIICAMFPKVPWSAGTAAELDKNRSLDPKPDLLKQSSQRACLVSGTPNRHPGWFSSSQKWRELRVEVNQVQPQLKRVIAHFTLSVALPLQGGHSIERLKPGCLGKCTQLSCRDTRLADVISLGSKVKYFTSEWHNRYVQNMCFSSVCNCKSICFTQIAPSS